LYAAQTLNLAPHLEEPEQLERLYRESPRVFERALAALDATHSERMLVRAWRARLGPAAVVVATGWATVALLATCAAVAARLVFFDGDDAGLKRLARFAGFIVLLPAAALLWKSLERPRALGRRDVLFALAALAALPAAIWTPIDHSQCGPLLLMHLPLLLLTLVFGALAPDLGAQRAEFVPLAAEIAIFSLAILFGGALLTGLTIGVFSLIHVDIGGFYFNNVVIAGAAAAPIVATGLERARSRRAERLGPALARIFSPLALVTLLAYAIAIMGSRSNPFTDRNSLAVLYAMLLATAMLVTLMVAQSGERAPSRSLLLTACAIASLSIAVDALALSAIVYRFTSYGLSPNRLAVLGGNLLLFGYLTGLALSLARAARREGEALAPLRWIGEYIPFFGIWSALWVFAFPALFGFR
jgi:hypothetical protein